MDGDRVDLSGLRRSYERSRLDVADVDPDPVVQFRRWLTDAAAAGVGEPNAMVLATASAGGVPAARAVLLKGLDDDAGFRFYTNHGSAKARDLAANPRAALVFVWDAVERQVRVTGPVARLSAAESAGYFASRPRDHQLGAWASRQSEPIADRAALDRRLADVAARFPPGTPIPVPDFWGGYRLRAEAVELWQGRHGRLHDRLRYRRGTAPDGGWLLERLQP